MKLTKTSAGALTTITNLNNLLLNLYIKRRSHKLGGSIPSDYKEILRNYSGLTSEYNVCFSFIKDGFCKTLNASSAIPGMIIFNYEWATHLILDKKGASDAFKVTIGHEISHQKKWFSTSKLSGVRKRFACWANEVYADFGSSLVVDGVDKDTIITALNYKRSEKKKDLDSNTHPSWARRIEYVTKHDFNQELIKMIASDAQCDDKELINKVTNFFPEIIL